MKTVVVRGPVFSKSGYGEHVRCILRALMSKEEMFDVYLIPTVWGNTGWRYDETDENKKFLFLCNKAQSFSGRYDISLQVCIPNEFGNLAEYNIGVTAAIETTRASSQWVQYSNFVDHLIVVSEHAKSSLTTPVFKLRGENDEPVGDEIKCDTDIDVIGYPIKEYEKIDLKLNLSTEFNFLTIAQVSPRKNISATVRSFINEFKDDDRVGLVMKINKVNDSLVDRHTVTQEIKNIIKTENLGDIKCKIYILHGPMSEQEIHSLYKQENIHAYITTTHGEGYGLPIFEAAYSGLPVMAPAWSGHIDFLYMPEENKVSKKVKKVPMFTKIRYKLDHVQEEALVENMIIPESKWSFVDIEACMKMMRHMTKTHKAQKSKALKLKEYLHEEYSSSKINEKIISSITKNFKEEEFSLDSWLETMEEDIQVNE